MRAHLARDRFAASNGLTLGVRQSRLGVGHNHAGEEPVIGSDAENIDVVILWLVFPLPVHDALQGAIAIEALVEAGVDLVEDGQALCRSGGIRYRGLQSGLAKLLQHQRLA